MNETKNIVITGVTSGLGEALAKFYLAADHHVYGCGRRESPLPEDSGRFQYCQLDIMDRDALAHWSEQIQSSASIDFLIHNAGVIGPNASLCETDPAELDRVIDINIKGSFYVLQAFVPKMIERKRGIIVTLSSGAGRFGFPTISAYCASKFGVEGLTQSLAEELPPPMAAIPFAPGIIDTPMLRRNTSMNAADFQKPVEWAERTGPMILSFIREHNGQSLSAPDPA